jgi:hypothetical protein
MKGVRNENVEEYYILANLLCLLPSAVYGGRPGKQKPPHGAVF